MAVCALCLGAWACDSQPAAVEPDAALYEPGARERPKSLRAVSVSVGTRHACAVTDTGRLVCWGEGAEVGRLDGSPGRVDSVTVGELATGIILETHDIVTHPSWPTETPEDAFPSAPLPPSALRGDARIVQFELAHGLDQTGCVLNAGGRVNCAYGRRASKTYDDSLEDFRIYSTPYGDFDEIEGRRWQWLSPHAGLNGCGLDANDAFHCWAGGTATDPIDPEDGQIDPFPAYEGTILSLPAETLHVCGSMSMACAAGADGRVQCWAAEIVDRPRQLSKHRFGETPALDFDGGDIVQLACGSLTGPAMYDPPFFGPPDNAQVCVLDARGRVTCTDPSGVSARLFAGTAMSAIDTSGATTCGTTRQGKVVCAAHTSDATQLSLTAVPPGLAP